MGENMSRPAPAETILIVDNDPAIIWLVDAVLRQDGYLTLTAEDGRQAVEIYRRRREGVALVIVEQNMPDISGLQTLNDLLALNPLLRVVLMRDASVPEAHQSRQTPGWSFLSKPWTVQQLRQAVRDALSTEREEGR
jgi:two-component system cell cycle sensor histidine kinase/response regulator CckA